MKNTKRLFFGFMAVAFLAMVTISTTVISEDSLDTTTSIKKKDIKRL